MTINFIDSIALATQPAKTSDGYLVATARVARSGIQVYDGAELGRPDLDKVRVYRPESEVFNDEAMKSFAYRPMTNNHPSEPVNATNWRDLSIGQTGGEVARDGEYIRVPMVLMDGEAIKDYEAGKRELSMGYSAEITFVDGVTETGEKYDAVQSNIRNNHLALVDKARAGDKARIGDSGDLNKTAGDNQGGMTMPKKIVFDGITIEVSEQAAEAIAKLSADLAAAQAEMEQAAEDAAKQAEAKDAELAVKDAEIQKLKDSVMTPEKLDAEIKQRVELIGQAKQLVDADYSGKTVEQIRKAAVVALIGDSVADKSDAYIHARFDALLDSKVEVVVKDGKPAEKSSYEKRLANAWQRGK